MTRNTIHIISLIIICLCSVQPEILQAQIKEGEDEYFVNDSLPLVVKEYDEASQQITLENPITFTPDPVKAAWYAALIPGGGQIYNRKYWKLPLIYGGYLGLTYAVTWNNKYYKGYSNAYRDLVEDNPSARYKDYISPSFDLSVESNRTWLENALKRKKNSYRRYRDLSIISMVGVYLVSILDAYVDASLYHFDISSDISLNLEPVVEPNINSDMNVGVKGAIKF